MLTSASIKRHALSLGFEVCGVAPATALPELQFLPEWLSRGYAGEMIYLHKSAETRADIRNFLPSAKSVIVAGAIYNTQQPDSESRLVRRSLGEGGDPGPGHVQVARYARGQDYHLVLAERLERLVEWMREQHAAPFETAIFVDKHHVQERVYAQYAGVGWIGKNSCVINPELGSFMFLCGIATGLALDVDAPATDQCGACTLCIDSCPTGAIVDAHVLDATKCISYLTIGSSAVTMACAGSGMRRFSTRPNAPCAPYSASRTTVFEKLGSSICGIDTSRTGAREAFAITR